MKHLVLIFLQLQLHQDSGISTEPGCSQHGEEYYPHTSHCHKFYHCSHGVPVEKSCPLGTEWAGGGQACDWPHNTHCQKGVMHELSGPAANNSNDGTFRGCSQFNPNTFISWSTG